MSEESKPVGVTLTADKDVPVTCPHCGKGFLHKVGDFFKRAGGDVVEGAVTIVFSGKGGT